MTHNEYWKHVKQEAESHVCALFEDCKTDIEDIVGDKNGIDSEKDAKKVLAYVLKHGTCHEQACAIISLSTWCHARHELEEHGSSIPAVSVP